MSATATPLNTAMAECSKY